MGWIILTDDSLMPFGKHKDTPMQDVPVEYLHYLWQNGMKNQVKTNSVADYIHKNLDVLKSENDDLIWS